MIPLPAKTYARDRECTTQSNKIDTGYERFNL